MESLIEFSIFVQNLLRKIRKLLLTLTVEELCTLEKVLCSMEEPKEICVANDENEKSSPSSSGPAQIEQNVTPVDMGLAAYCAAVPDSYFQNFFAAHPECRALLAPASHNRSNVSHHRTVCNTDKTAPTVLVDKQGSTTAVRDAGSGSERGPSSSSVNVSRTIPARIEDENEESSDKSSTSDTDVDDDNAHSSSLSESGGDDDTTSSSVSSVASGGAAAMANAEAMVNKIKGDLDSVVEPEPEKARQSEVDKLRSISCSCTAADETVSTSAACDSSVMKKEVSEGRSRQHHQHRHRHGQRVEGSGETPARPGMGRRTVSEPGHLRSGHQRSPQRHHVNSSSRAGRGSLPSDAVPFQSRQLEPRYGVSDHGRVGSVHRSLFSHCRMLASANFLNKVR
jgi:hypothetical protein